MVIKSSLLLIDGDFIPYYATQGNKVLDIEGNPLRENNKFVYTPRTEQEVYDAVDNIMVNIFRATNIYNYIGFLGGKKCFRYDIYPDYKANRKDFVKPNFWQECKSYLIDRWNYQICHYIEADDAVNITRNKLLEKYNIIIVTSDKDLIKCISGTYLDPRNFNIIYTQPLEAEYNFWSSMIIGDTADNIKGLKGCGPKYRDAVFRNSENKNYKDLIKEHYDIQKSEDFELNYNLLKILDDKEDFVVPEVQTNFVRDVEW